MSQGHDLTGARVNGRGDSAVQVVAAALGPLPPVARYFDEYAEKLRSLEPGSPIWTIEVNGRTISLKFGALSDPHAHVIKHFFISRLHKNAVTAAYYAHAFLRTLETQISLVEIACSDEAAAIDYLRTDFRSCETMESAYYFQVGKTFLFFLCEMNLAGWRHGHANILKSIGSPVRRDKARSVRDGSAIMNFEEERKIVGFFDDLNDLIARDPASDISTQDLRNANILFWNYAHGMRPIQIANRNISDARLRYSEKQAPIVHVTFRYAKQRGAAKALEQTRKMKREWTPMMKAWLVRRESLHPDRDFDRPGSLFGVTPQDVSSIVADLTTRITGVRRIPYDLRHSAAQRKADAGCSRLELAEFLMHHDIDTADAYIEMSPTQAEKINQALGLSPLFQAMDKALKSRSVNFDELRAMPPDQQIGAAPHGHLIAGIGGCSVGQSFCTKTPALACYECVKFMYLRDLDVHRAARKSVQEIIQEFIAAGRTDRTSPAFIQLRRVVETIDAIIEDLEHAAAGPEDQ